MHTSMIQNVGMFSAPSIQFWLIIYVILKWKPTVSHVSPTIDCDPNGSRIHLKDSQDVITANAGTNHVSNGARSVLEDVYLTLKMYPKINNNAALSEIKKHHINFVTYSLQIMINIF